MKFIKPILLFFCITFYFGNLYAQNQVGDKMDISNIEKVIKNEHPKPPLLKDGEIWKQGVDISNYFTQLKQDNLDVFHIKKILEEQGYVTSWRNEKGERVQDVLQAKSLNSLKEYKNKIPLIGRDKGITIGVFFDNTGKVLEIKAIYFKYPY